MNKKVITTTLTLGIFVVTTVILYRSSIDLGDWPLFHSVSQTVLRGGNPYLTQTIIDGVKLCFYNPPWVVAITIPYSFLPLRLGWAMLNATSFIAVLFVARKLGASFLVLLVAVPIIYRAIWTGNVDGFSFFGAALPTPVGLFFTALKPQNTLGLMLFWVFWMWRLGGLRRLSLTFAPVVLALVIAFTAFPPWETLSCSFSTPAHLALFPAGVPAGLAILTLAIALKRKYLALAASPFLSPYISYAAIVLMPLWGLMFLQDLARWLFRAGVLTLAALHHRRNHYIVEPAPD